MSFNSLKDRLISGVDETIDSFNAEVCTLQDEQFYRIELGTVLIEREIVEAGLASLESRIFDWQQDLGKLSNSDILLHAILSHME